MTKNYNYKRLIEILNNAILKNPNSSELYRERGRAKFLLNLYQKNKSPKGFKALYEHKDEEYQDPIEDYNIAVELNPNDALCYLYMAEVVNTIKDKGFYCDKAIEVDPQYINAYEYKIHWYMEYNMWEPAIETMKLMLKNNPTSQRAKDLFNSCKEILGKTYDHYNNA